MTISIDWSVYIGGFYDGTSHYTAIREGLDVPVSSVDFTSRVRGFDVDHRIGLGTSGRSKARVTLDNSDGKLTPNDIGGAGDYSSKDWFSLPLFITAGSRGLSNAPSYFVGPIVDFDFFDDGFDSYLTLEALDWQTFISRFTYQSAIAAATKGVDQFITTYIIGNSGASESIRDLMPAYGANGKTVTTSSTGTWSTVSLGVEVGDFSGDLMETVIASDGGFSYPARLLFEEVSGPSSRLSYQWFGMPRKQLAASSYQSTSFKSSDSLGSTGLPFRKLKLGYNINDMITQATVTRAGGTAQTSYNDTSTGTWGPRSISIAELALTSDTDALDLANWFTGRFSTVDFVPSSFEITGSMIEKHCPDTALSVVRQLVAPNSETEGILFKPCSISWTGAGSQTCAGTVAPVRSLLKVTPNDWSMRIYVKDAATVFAFILDSALLGVLDSNRIG